MSASRRQPLLFSSASHCFHFQLAFSFHREVGAIFARPHQRDQFRAATSLVESGTSAEDAVVQAKSAWGRRYTRTTTSPTVDADLEAFALKYQKLSDELAAEGGKPLFRHVYCYDFHVRPLQRQRVPSHEIVDKQRILHRSARGPFRVRSSIVLSCAVSPDRKRNGAQASTMEAIENVRKCARKGCLNPGLSVKDAYIVDGVGPETGLRTFHKIVGTGKCESLHRWVHAIAPLSVSSLSSWPIRVEEQLATKWRQAVRRTVVKPY